MQRAKIVITSRVHPEIVERLSAYGLVVANQGSEPWSARRLSRELSDAQAMMAFMPDCVDAALLNAAPKLRIVACALKGHDNFDVTACTRGGVWVSIVDDLLTIPTAELTIGLMIGLARHVAAGDRVIRSGTFAGWRPSLYGSGLNGVQVGTLGMGAIGRAVAERLAAFGCQLTYWDRRRLPVSEEARLKIGFTDLDQLFATADFVVCALPLNADSLHLVDADSLARLKPGAILVNPARGGLVDEEAVADALISGRLAGYAADAFAFEDWARPNRPETISPRLLAMRDHTLFTPHLGSAVASVRLAIERQAANNIVDVLEGRPPRNAVNEPEPAATALR